MNYRSTCRFTAVPPVPAFILRATGLADILSNAGGSRYGERVSRHDSFCEIKRPALLVTQTERPPRGGLSEITIYALGYAASAAAFFFLRQPSRPNAPRPVAKSGSVAGSGTGFIAPNNPSLSPLM